jgi:PAS domain S-box-containing protein
MSGALFITLSALVSIMGYASLHHALVGFARPRSSIHLLFALWSLLFALYVASRIGSYRAETVESLILTRRIETSLAMLVTAVLPWFAGAYLGLKNIRPIQIGITAGCVLLVVVNVMLPFGASFASQPTVESMALPWGERVTDIRVFNPEVWFVAGVTLISFTFAWGLYISLRTRLAGKQRRRAATLAACLTLLIGGVIGSFLVDWGLLQGPHTAEFAFVMLVVMLDIELSHERRQFRSRIQGVLDNVPAAVCIKLADGRYMMVNCAYAELFQLSEQSVTGKTDRDLFPGQRAEEVNASDQEVLRSLQVYRAEEPMGEGEGARIFAALKFPLTQPDGTADALCAIYTDVTDRRRSEREMDALRRQVWHADRVERTAVLAASLAHEMSQPLTAILSNAQAALRFLAQDEPDLAEVRAILQDVVRDDKRASAVINGLRTMLRRQDTPRECIDIGICVGEVVDLMHSDCVVRGIRVERSLAQALTTLADKAQIQQVLLNLLMNANEAMAEMSSASRRLQVSVSQYDDSQLLVAVRDEGPGIATEDLERVFDNFYTTKAKGLGMGLAVCRAIIEAHGGRLWAEKNVGSGVTFKFNLANAP